MDNPPIEKRFFFHANAVGFAARMLTPSNYFIPAVASSCLPVTGGEGRTTETNLKFGNVLSCDSASTNVRGVFIDEEDGGSTEKRSGNVHFRPTSTISESRIKGLRIVNGPRVLEIGSLEATMVALTNDDGKPEFRSLSAKFESVRVDGVALTIETHTNVLEEFSTKERLSEAYARDPAFRERYGHCFFGIKPTNPKEHKIPEMDGLIYGTVVTGLKWGGEGPFDAVIKGNSVTITNFGAIYLGEIVIEEDFRRLTLLRFQLGSDTSGSGSAAEVQANGSTWPPKKGGG